MYTSTPLRVSYTHLLEVFVLVSLFGLLHMSAINYQPPPPSPPLTLADSFGSSSSSGSEPSSDPTSATRITSKGSRRGCQP
mmetsp:Transcript_38741/g.122030  ORF Transcript_38741/g.122030 Transcript_38741/m.122030 type:complete len:81 (+) Transcript_38741:292-534(+)